jgi:hypothetical protein
VKRHRINSLFVPCFNRQHSFPTEAKVLICSGFLFLSLSVPSYATAAAGWRISVEEHDDGARTVLTALPRAARATAAICERKGLKLCLGPIKASFLLADCRDQGMGGRRLARQMRRASQAGPVRFFTETGGYPWRCVV